MFFLSASEFDQLKFEFLRKFQASTQTLMDCVECYTHKDAQEVNKKFVLANLPQDFTDPDREVFQLMCDVIIPSSRALLERNFALRFPSMIASMLSPNLCSITNDESMYKKAPLLFFYGRYDVRFKSDLDKYDAISELAQFGFLPDYWKNFFLEFGQKNRSISALCIQMAVKGHDSISLKQWDICYQETKLRLRTTQAKGYANICRMFFVSLAKKYQSAASEELKNQWAHEFLSELNKVPLNMKDEIEATPVVAGILFDKHFRAGKIEAAFNDLERFRQLNPKRFSELLPEIECLRHLQKFLDGSALSQNLPPEILDKIIEDIDTDDGEEMDLESLADELMEEQEENERLASELIKDLSLSSESQPVKFVAQPRKIMSYKEQIDFLQKNKEKTESFIEKRVEQAKQSLTYPPKVVPQKIYALMQGIFRGNGFDVIKSISFEDWRECLRALGGDLKLDKKKYKATLPSRQNPSKICQRSFDEKHEKTGDNNLLWLHRKYDRSFVKGLLEDAGYIFISDFHEESH